MIRTLYKTKNPMKSVQDGEFYELALQRKRVGGAELFFVTETHGWWDESGQRTVHLMKTLSPVEGFPTLPEAQAVYERQVRERVSNGFAHSFTPDFFGHNDYVYEDLRKG